MLTGWFNEDFKSLLKTTQKDFENRNSSAHKNSIKDKKSNTNLKNNISLKKAGINEINGKQNGNIKSETPPIEGSKDQSVVNMLR